MECRGGFNSITTLLSPCPLGHFCRIFMMMFLLLGRPVGSFGAGGAIPSPLDFDSNITNTFSFKILLKTLDYYSLLLPPDFQTPPPIFLNLPTALFLAVFSFCHVAAFKQDFRESCKLSLEAEVKIGLPLSSWIVIEWFWNPWNCAKNFTEIKQKCNTKSNEFYGTSKNFFGHF